MIPTHSFIFLLFGRALIQTLSFCTSKDAGRFGIFANANVRHKAARGWWGSLKASVGYGPQNVALASFPLSSALTAGNVLRGDGQQAELLRELAELGVADERLVVMLHLLVER